MPTIGWFEILIVVAIAIVVLGPKDFPLMLKKAGSWIGTAKRYINDIQNEVSHIDIDDEKINEIIAAINGTKLTITKALATLVFCIETTKVILVTENVAM